MAGPKARERLLEALTLAWNEEPGDTVADLANAISRTAHQLPDLSREISHELERRAARLVLVQR